MSLTREQKIARRAFIGSSDVPAIVGLSPHKGPFAVYLDKVPQPCPVCDGKAMEDRRADEYGVGNFGKPCEACGGSGELEPFDDDPTETDARAIGSLAEPLIASLYERRTGRRLSAHPMNAVHARHPWAAASPDRVSDDGGPDVELKMIGGHSASEWGEGGEDIPAHYRVQVEWQMEVRDRDVQHVAAIVGGTSFRIYEIRRSRELGAELVDAAHAFRKDHLLARVPPPFDGTEAARAFLRRRYPESVRGMQPAPLQAMPLVLEMRELKARIKSDGERLDHVKALLQEMIGDAEGIEDEAWGKVTWTTQAGAVSWKGIAEELAMRLAWERYVARSRGRDVAPEDALVLDAIRSDVLAETTLDLARTIETHRNPPIRVLRESEKTTKKHKKGRKT